MCLKICLIMHMNVFLACLHGHHLHAWYLAKVREGNKSLELELQTRVHHHVEAGNQTSVLCKSSEGS